MHDVAPSQSYTRQEQKLLRVRIKLMTLMVPIVAACIPA